MTKLTHNEKRSIYYLLVNLSCAYGMAAHEVSFDMAENELKYERFQKISSEIYKLSRKYAKKEDEPALRDIEGVNSLLDEIQCMCRFDPLFIVKKEARERLAKEKAEAKDE